jgi:hypothetical protein
MEVFITKYALTKGVIKVEAMLVKPSMVAFSQPHCREEYCHGKDWHETREDAVAHAETMRLKKISSLDKQIARLQKLTF